MAADAMLYAVDDTVENRQLIRDADAYLNGRLDSPDALYALHENSDLVGVSAVSFGKATSETFDYWVPGPVQGLFRAMRGEMMPKVITEGLSKDILSAINTADRSHYRAWERRYSRVERKRRVKRFLERNVGRLVFVEID